MLTNPPILHDFCICVPISCLLNMVGAFNQEKALVGAFPVIVQLHRLIVYTALEQIHHNLGCGGINCSWSFL